MRPHLALLAALLLALPAASRAPAKPDLRTIEAQMQALVARYRLDGASLWVSHNGRDMMVGHYGGYTDATRVPIASASKWVSALVLARLVERGALRWDSTVGEWWPTVPAEKRGITLAQLFSHTSGLPGDESGCIGNPDTTLQACAAQILAGPMIAAPGTAFAYGGLSMQVAGAMAERATGLSWNALFASELLAPLGLTSTDYGFTSSSPGFVSVTNPRIAGGVRSTLADHRRLMAMWQADGVIRVGPMAGQRYLAVATIRAMQRDHSAGLRRLGTPPSVDRYPGWGYGFGFWILPTGRAGNPAIESSPGAFGFQGWVDGAAGVAGVFMVRDSNARLAPEVQQLQREVAGLFELQRSAQRAVASSSRNKPDLQGIDFGMQSLVERYRLDGASLWVSHNGRDAMTGHYGGYDEATRIPIASASKWISALVLARLVERGTLRWDSTVGEWWPAAPAEKRSITLSQLFSHTSGLPGEEFGCINDLQTTLQACAAQILAGPMLAPPASVFAYGSLSMQVAGAMAERATGRSWDALLQTELLAPLGLTSTDYGFTQTTPGYVAVSNPRIDGGARSTLEDYRRLMAMWQADGLIQVGPNRGQRYLASSTIRAMQRDHARGTTRVDAPPTVELYPGWGYGFGFWILPAGRAGNTVIESSPGGLGFQGWVDGTAGVAAVFMVRDSNRRLASEVQQLQREIAQLFELQRFTQRERSCIGAHEAPPPRGEIDRREAPGRRHFD